MTLTVYWKGTVLPEPAKSRAERVANAAILSTSWPPPKSDFRDVLIRGGNHPTTGGHPDPDGDHYTMSFRTAAQATSNVYTPCHVYTKTKTSEEIKKITWFAQSGAAAGNFP